VLVSTATHGRTLAADRMTGTQHALYNADNTTDLVYTLTHRPAGPMGEAFFENYAGECYWG